MLIILLVCPIPESVKEAIKTLRDNNVKSFALDLRNNRFGSAETGIHLDFI
jgi:carboxyl-terminal processing protease